MAIATEVQSIGRPHAVLIKSWQIPEVNDRDAVLQGAPANALVIGMRSFGRAASHRDSSTRVEARKDHHLIAELSDPAQHSVKPIAELGRAHLRADDVIGAGTDCDE
jgi:hypothetical protein